MKAAPHSAIITKAARKHLAPLGVRQKGGSRFWYDDHAWFLIGVEFQPSGFAKGTYLNVGCCWLWVAKDHFSFDYGYREEPFKEFSALTEWEEVADGLARRAADQVERYRFTITSFQSVADHYRRQGPSAFWPRYHAGVAAGLVGDVPEATQYFLDAIAETRVTSPAWQVEAVAACRQWLAKLSQPDVFRTAVVTEIGRARTLMNLPALERPIFAEGAA